MSLGARATCIKKKRARTKLAMRTEQKNSNKLAKSYVRASQELVEI